MEQAYKLCRACGGEYLPSVERCPDCGQPLVWEGEAAEAPGEPELVLPSGEGLLSVREAELGFARGLGQALAAAGIPHRLDPPGVRRAGAEGREVRSARWAVLVRAADAAQAAAVDAAHTRRELGNLGSELDGTALEGQCPACGEPLEGDSAECRGCGLVFGPAQ